MIRILIFMGLIAMGMLIASCGLIIPVCRFGAGEPLNQTIRKTLELVKKEAAAPLY